MSHMDGVRVSLTCSLGSMHRALLIATRVVTAGVPVESLTRLKSGFKRMHCHSTL